MTRRAVQIALFATIGWMLTLTTLVVLVLAVRAPVEPDWVVSAWLLVMAGTAVVAVLGLLSLVAADTVRGGRLPAEVTPSSEVGSDSPDLVDDTLEDTGAIDESAFAGLDGEDLELEAGEVGSNGSRLEEDTSGPSSAQPSAQPSAVYGEPGTGLGNVRVLPPEEKES